MSLPFWPCSTEALRLPANKTLRRCCVTQSTRHQLDGDCVVGIDLCLQDVSQLQQLLLSFLYGKQLLVTTAVAAGAGAAAWQHHLS